MKIPKFINSRPFFLLFCLLAAFALYTYQPVWFQKFAFGIEDSKFAFRSAIGKSPVSHKDVFIVTVDERSVNKLGRWPWSRKVIAELFGKLNQAKTVALDIVFSEESSSFDDELLAETIEDNENIILGFFFREKATENTSEEDFEYLDECSYTEFEQKSDIIKVKEYPAAEINIPIVMETGAPCAFFTAIPDNDGLYRQYPLVLMHKGVLFPPLAVQSYRYYYNKDAHMVLSDKGVESFELGDFKAKNSNFIRLNYYEDVKYISAIDIINGAISPEYFKDKFVIIGVTEVGIYDMRPTPMDSVTPGVSLHYTALSNILNNEVLRDAKFVDYALMFVYILLAFLAGHIKRQIRRVGVNVSLMLSVFAVSYTLFVGFNIWLHEFFIFFPMFLLIVFLETQAFFTSEAKAREVKKAFSSYVSPDLVDKIIKDPDKLQLGGEEREISIMFSDIRGFTSLSEKLTPPRLVSMLNSIHDPMTKVILEKRGMLDKYIGDAMMCLFNTPVDLENHADMAVESALELIRVLHRINIGFERDGLPVIDVGVGVNSGLAVCGNMGSTVRFEYTAIGDSVNLASRLEGLCKVYKCRIVISEYTKDMLTETFLMRKLDRVRVKGKNEPVEIFEVKENAEPNITLFSEYNNAMELYFNRRFSEALELFKKLESEYDDATSGVFVERCEHFLAEPPETGWDGVFTLKSK